MGDNFNSNPFNFQECDTDDLINGLMHMSDDHPCCRETIQMAIGKIQELESKIENCAPTIDMSEKSFERCYHLMSLLAIYEEDDLVIFSIEQLKKLRMSIEDGAIRKHKIDSWKREFREKLN